MSRCFPYPPPGYTPSRASNEALIESIKLQRERENAKAERKKEKKREKKEKKAKEAAAKQIKTAHLDHQKERKDDTEQLERSSITEEHERPISLQNPSYSSDSTENSGKRKRHSSPLNGTRTQGNILRIRLPSQKRIKHDIRDGKEQLSCMPSEKQVKDEKHRKNDIRGGEVQLCSTSGRPDVPAEHNNNITRADADTSHPTSQAAEFIVHDHHPLTVQELRQPNTVEPHDDTCYLENVNTDSGSKRNRKLKRVAERYRDLIENWTPSSMLSETTDNDDDDWLFPRKHEVNRPEKTVRVGPEMTCSSNSALWPRAHFLPGADIYALPYAIPF